MIRINLLPLSERPPLWRTGRMFFTAALAIFLILAGAYTYNAVAIYQAEEQLQQLQTSYELLRPTEGKMADALKRQQSINAKNAVLFNLTKTRVSWYAVLTELAAKTPTNLWLTDVKCDKGVLSVVGLARNYSDVALFMQQLDKDELLAEPALVKTGKDQTLPVTRFEMTVKFKGM